MHKTPYNICSILFLNDRRKSCQLISQKHHLQKSLIYSTTGVGGRGMLALHLR